MFVAHTIIHALLLILNFESNEINLIKGVGCLAALTHTHESLNEEENVYEEEAPSADLAFASIECSTSSCFCSELDIDRRGV